MLISHFLREVLELADTVTVLRDGKVIRTSPTVEETEATLVEAMLGRPPDDDVSAEAASGGAASVLLTVENLEAAGVANASFEVRAGEVVGIAGLVGAGRTELARAIFGANRIEEGSARIGAGDKLGRSPRRSLDAGVALIPESRKDQGLIFGRSAVENTTLSQLRELSRLGVVRRRAERRASGMLDRCDARRATLLPSIRSPAGTSRRSCSRGACSASRRSARGRADPRRRRRSEARDLRAARIAGRAGHGDRPHLVRARGDPRPAHRVLVMRSGRLVAELAGEAMTESAILAAAFADRSAGGIAA